MVSILIGINDSWRRYDSDDPTPKENFEADYRYILRQTRDQLHTKLILCEPFVLPVSEDRAAWREDLDPKISVVRKLAAEFNAIFLPLDGIFAQAAARGIEFLVAGRRTSFACRTCAYRKELVTSRGSFINREQLKVTVFIAG